MFKQYFYKVKTLCGVFKIKILVFLVYVKIKLLDFITLGFSEVFLKKPLWIFILFLFFIFLMLFIFISYTSFQLHSVLDFSNVLIVSVVVISAFTSSLHNTFSGSLQTN